MKKLAALWISIFISLNGFSQVKIHAHNDYLQKQVFKLAYENRVFEIEADVFEVAGELFVAHTKMEINPKNTLKKLYLDPIDSLFKLYQGKVSADRNYTFTLMIDFKTPWPDTYQVLKQQVEKYGHIFNRSTNKNAVQIVVSGNRPPETSYHTFPNWLYFDGVPNVKYQKEDLKKVTMISENFKVHSKWKGTGKMDAAELMSLKKIVDEAKRVNKPVRFWGAPDTPDTWRTLHDLGAEIINTDKIEQCKTFLNFFK